MPTPTLDSLQAALDALTTRVTSLDGIGIGSGLTSDVDSLQAQITGVRADLQQAILTMQTLYTGLASTVASLTALVNQKIGGQS